MKDELFKQWQKDIDDYGDNAYKMYKFTWLHDDNFKSCLHNQQVISDLNDKRFKVSRKQSAELPFDFERAKSGDEIEFYIGESGLSDFEFSPITVKFIGESSTYSGLLFVQDAYDYHHVPVDKLQMKYPQKVKK